ncbi:MAG: hypothetical protein ACLQBX_02075, partial [Candidatus Limnocylindrales bacterium]
MNVKAIGAVALIVIGVGAVGFAVIKPSLGSSDATQYLTSTAAVGNVLVQAVATGTVQSTAAYGLSFGADPEVISSASTTTTSSSTTATTWNVETVPVTVGPSVTKGQVLATADPGNAQVGVAIAKANLAAAQARLDVDEGHPASTALAAAQNALNQASLSYSSTQHSQASTLQQAELAVTQAKQSLANAQSALATAEAGPTADQLDVLQNAVTQAQLNLQSDQQSQTSTLASDKLALQAAQLAVTNAENAYSLGPTATNQAAITTAEQALASLQLKNQSAEQQAANKVQADQNALATAQANLTSGSVPSSTTVQNAQQAVQSAQTNLVSAEQRLAAAKVSQGDSLASAQQSLASAQTNYATQTGPQSASTIASDEAAVSTAQSNLTNAESTAAHTTLTAPDNGQIVAINVEPNTIAPVGWAITMQTTALQATASFAESAVVGLKVGQPATVTVTAPGVNVPGTVSAITPVGTSSGTNSVVTFAVTVALTNAPSTVLSGMSASVAVTTAQALNVVTVPAISVVGSSGSYEVRVLSSAGQEQLVPVTVGLMSSSLAEIQSGISAGQTVITGTVSALNSTTTTGTTGGLGGIGALSGGGGGGGGFRVVTRGTTSGGAAGAGAA